LARGERTTPSAEAAATPPSEGGESEGDYGRSKSRHIGASGDQRRGSRVVHAADGEIVKYVEQLNELDTGDVEPMLGGLTDEGEATVTTREDVIRPSLTQKEALDQAPSPVAGHFQVPKVL
jgi:aspartyl/glutamyl-tRNA(Asn/Gln) amidotransferase C subunit